jgi:hypothetical protein
MPHTRYSRTADGMVLDVLVGLDGQRMAGLVAAGQPLPPPLLVRAQIDSGSTISCIATRVVAHFNLARFQGHTTQTIAGSSNVNLYEVSLSIPRSASLPAPLLVEDRLVVMELPHPLANVEALIGLDLLDKLLLINDGPRGDFTLAS